MKCWKEDGQRVVFFVVLKNSDTGGELCRPQYRVVRSKGDNTEKDLHTQTVGNGAVELPCNDGCNGQRNTEGN